MKDDSIARIALIVVKVLKSLGFSGGEPKKCPVCDGHGYVSDGFYPKPQYSSSAINVVPTCRACNGMGLVR